MRTIEEKLEHFTTVTIDNINAECEKSLSEYKDELDKKFEAHKAESLRLSKLKEKNLVDAIERRASKEYTLEQLHIKRKINHKQTELRDKLFADVRAKLLEYKATPAYKELLIREIEQAKLIARGDEMDIYIDPEDEKHIKELEDRCKIKLILSERSFMGGIRAEIHSKNILIDNTFETEIEEAKEKFMITL